MPRWSSEEQSLLHQIRQRLQADFSQAPAYPEVVGDRKLIRFLRGHDHNLEKVITLVRNFLRWRRENQVDHIRQQIVEGGCNHPLKFPKGELIAKLIPSLAIAPDATDILGCPICVEQYNFSPNEVMSQISIEDYLLYTIYTLEYRSVILEQLSEQQEKAYLEIFSDEERCKQMDPDEKDLEPYGVLAFQTVIRDLNGVGFEHLGSKGQDIIKAVVGLATDNYPELMRKCYMVNTPWIFNTVWFFIKGLLAARTIAKVSVMGTSFIDEISKEIPLDNLPKLVGGSYIGYQEYKVFPFDLAYLCPHLSEQLNANEEEVPLNPEAMLHLNQQLAEMTVAEVVAEELAEEEDFLAKEEAEREDVRRRAAVVQQQHREAEEAAAVEKARKQQEDSPPKPKKKKEFVMDIDLIALQTSGF